MLSAVRIIDAVFLYRDLRDLAWALLQKEESCFYDSYFMGLV